MPLYSWACRKCKKALDVLRSFDGYRDPPTEEEGGTCGVDITGDELDTHEHDWDKVINAPLVTKGAGWGGGKGRW